MTTDDRRDESNLQLARQVLAIEGDAVHALRSRIDRKFLKAVELLETCKGRVITTGIGKSGIIAKKVGMTRLFLEDGKQVPVTVLHMENLQVIAQRTSDANGYTALQLGAGTVKAKIQVAELLSLKAKANLHGDIITNKLSIEPGANFTGSCSMGASVKNIKLSETNDKSKEKTA